MAAVQSLSIRERAEWVRQLESQEIGTIYRHCTECLASRDALTLNRLPRAVAV